MSQTNDRPSPEATETRQYQGGGGHRGLVLGAAVLISGAVILAGVYGITVGAAGSVMMKALALEGAMVALAAWLSLHAFRIRGRLLEAQEWEPQQWDDLEEEEVNVTLEDVQHSRNIHYLVLAAPATLILGLLAVFLLWNQAAAESVLPNTHRAAASVLCLVACCVWLVLSKSLEAAGKEDLPEGPALMLAFREIQWATLLVAAGILATNLWSETLEIWVAGLLLVWLVVVSAEQLVRIAAAWLGRAPLEKGFVSPLYLLAREAVFVRGNPIASIFETIEARFGVSIRSSWAIRFVRAAAVPSLVAVLLLFWGVTCLSVVGTGELGIRESFGRIQAAPLQPGLHWKLPWPFGRIRHYPVKEVSTMPVGFDPGPARQKAYLWTKAHAEEEHPFVLGEKGTEAVSVGAVVYYKISEDPNRFLDYVYRWSWQTTEQTEAAPEAEAERTLNAYAYRALMEQTRSSNVEEVLEANRAEFADRLKQSLRRYSQQNRLGLDVIDVALLIIHPPIEVADAYLDVISAEIDASRYKIEAEGQRLVAITNAEIDRSAMVDQAEVNKARRIGEASEQSAQFLAIREAYSAAPDAFKLRLWFEVLEQTLGPPPPEPPLESGDKESPQSPQKPKARKRLLIVDERFTAGPEDLLIDLRPAGQRKNEVVPSGVR